MHWFDYDQPDVPADAWFSGAPWEYERYAVDHVSYESGSVIITDWIWSDGTVEEEITHYPSTPVLIDADLPF